MAHIVNGQTYGIVNTFHQECLGILKGSANGVKVAGGKYKGLLNQLWKVTVKGQNAFEFAILNQPDPNKKFVLDATRGKDAVVYQSHGGPNQVWMLEPIREGAFLYFIKNKRDGRVIQSDGIGRAVSLQQQNPTNQRQMWTFEEKI